MINKLPNNTLTVQSLIGRNEISFYLECLSSLIKYSNDKINLVLHTVDKFSDREKNLLEKSLSNCTFEVLNAQKNAEKTLDYLCNYPNCQKFRKRSLWGVEFFDPLFARPDEHVSFYIDADILFFRPFEGLFNKEVVQNGAAFLRDTQWDAYSLRPWQLWGIEKKPAIVKGITTALVFWHAS